MPVGLQIWDAAGNIVLDTNYRTARRLGSVVTGTSNGSLSIPDLVQGQPFFISEPLLNNVAYYVLPNVTISGTTLSWSFPSQYPSSRNSMSITYGVF